MDALVKQVSSPLDLLQPTTLQHSTMSNHQALVEALLMKSILGQELVDTKFHIFSGCSAHLLKVVRLQALSANDVVLTACSEFLAELLSRAGSPDVTFVDFDGGSVFEGCRYERHNFFSRWATCTRQPTLLCEILLRDRNQQGMLAHYHESVHLTEQRGHQYRRIYA
ncbi:hypothetical protein BD769DRAFT_1724187 [Suillus cothurnatus]|nr:hypothetical protein BD769DRAFT_1724187 [Suillus cothurnatus]